MSSSFDMNKLKDINTKTQFLVFGYIRNIEDTLLSTNVPPLISYVCLAFYFLGEYFEKIGGCTKLNDENRTVISDSIGGSTCYGAVNIKSMVEITHIWTFKINKKYGTGGMVI
eukprot:204684_1